MLSPSPTRFPWANVQNLSYSLSLKLQPQFEATASVWSYSLSSNVNLEESDPPSSSIRPINTYEEIKLSVLPGIKIHRHAQRANSQRSLREQNQKLMRPREGLREAIDLHYYAMLW